MARVRLAAHSGPMTDPTRPPPRQPASLAQQGEPFFGAAFSVRGGPAAVLVAICVAVALAEPFTGGPMAWGLSAQALREGRWWTLFTHMVAHGGLMHLLFNCAALLALSTPVMMGLGSLGRAVPRYLLLFVGSGLAGALLYLAFHPTGAIPMVGASGAICGLWGAASRLGLDGLAPLTGPQVQANVRNFIVMNVVMVLFLFGISGGQGGGLAWEAHLGGFVFGLFAMPRLASPPPWFPLPPQASPEPVDPGQWR